MYPKSESEWCGVNGCQVIWNQPGGAKNGARQTTREKSDFQSSEAHEPCSKKRKPNRLLHDAAHNVEVLRLITSQPLIPAVQLNSNILLI